MSEQPMPGGGLAAGPAASCPWCSAPLPAAIPERCPACLATLLEAQATEVPGLTRVDHEALLRSRAPAPRSRGLIGWLSGEYEARPPAEAPGTLAPPADEVRREMLRLELAALEAEVHALEAEAAALAVLDGTSGEGRDEAAINGGPGDVPGAAALDAAADEEPGKG